VPTAVSTAGARRAARLNRNHAAGCCAPGDHPVRQRRVERIEPAVAVTSRVARLRLSVCPGRAAIYRHHRCRTTGGLPAVYFQSARLERLPVDPVEASSNTSDSARPGIRPSRVRRYKFVDSSSTPKTLFLFAPDPIV